MKYSKYLYMPEELIKKKKKIIRRLEAKKFQPNIYLVTLSDHKNSHLEIFNAALLLQKNFPQKEYFVVGLAKSLDDALELVEKITQEVYDITKDADIRTYITQKEQER